MCVRVYIIFVSIFLYFMSNQRVYKLVIKFL